MIKSFDIPKRKNSSLSSIVTLLVRVTSIPKNFYLGLSSEYRSYH